MTGPLPEADRREGLRRVGAGFVVVVGISAGSTAYFSGASPLEAAAACLAGLLVGGLLVLFLGVR